MPRSALDFLPPLDRLFTAPFSAKLPGDDATNHRQDLMTIRRLPQTLVLIPVLAAVVAGCSSGSSKVAGSKAPTTPSTTAATTAQESSAPAAKISGGGATDFCTAIKELDSAGGATTPAAAGAAFRAAAADMRRYAPPAIKDAAGTYADVMDGIGKAAQSGSFDQEGLQKAIAERMAGKAADMGKVGVWVGQNCHQ